MLLFDLIKMWEPTFAASKTKVHLARHNGLEHPMDVFLEGAFDEWQRWQTRQNFKRAFVVSLVQADTPNRWLFAGLFRKVGCEQRETDHYYTLERIESAEEWAGRLFVSSKYKERNSYPKGETLEAELLVTELLPKRVSIGDFPGYKNVNITKVQLDLVINQRLASWRAALSSVKGIYLITDTSNGKLYVGKADGAEGIWGRWSVYAATNHGHNVALKKEFGIEAEPGRKQDLRFSVLEVADLHATTQDIDRRESHWKEILLTRIHGYNRN